MLNRWRRRIRYWLQSGERARLLREEMQAHLDLKTQELIEQGMTESDARSAARRQFGNPTRFQEESRGTWIARWFTDLTQDVVFAARTLRKQPGFTAVAVLSAALGIGACSMIFGIANFALFRPLPVSEPFRLESISRYSMRSGKVGQSMSYPDIQDLQQARSFEAIAAYFQFMPAAISAGNAEPQRSWGSIVTANYFDVVRPAFTAGRGFDAARDDKKGEPPVVVLSHQLWRSRFDSDRSIIGRAIDLNNLKVTVVGVTAPGFRGTEVAFYSDFWIPFSMIESLAAVGMGGNRLQDRDSQWLMAAGRRREGVSQQQAIAEVDVIGKRLGDAYPATNKERGFHVERAGQIHPGFRKMIVLFFVMLIVVAGLVLLTACANVANLLLARASARQKEIGTRLAIGAGRGRLVRQLLTESVMLALLGGIGGFAIAQAGALAIGNSSVPLSLPVDLSFPLDYRVMLFCTGLSALTGVFFGLIPALRATRPDLVGALKEEEVNLGHSPRLGLRKLLVVAQVAICMVLLICSGLFLRSLDSARNIETGFANRNILLLAFDPRLNRYSPSDTRRIVDAMIQGTRALPGVESAALGDSIPLNMEGTQNTFVPEDKIGSKQDSNIRADIYAVGPAYFETFGIRMFDGEDFRPGLPSEDIAIVNQALAAKAFPNQNPIGRRIQYFGKMLRIIGLVATTKSRSIGEDPHPCLYLPIEKDLKGNDSLTGMTLAVRTRGNPASYAQSIRQIFRDIAPDLAVFDVRTMDTHLTKALFLPRVAAFLFGLAGIIGLLISTIGIYGVISFAVARQTKDIGIRVALGARRGQILAMVLKQGILLTTIGAAIGFAIALAASRTAASLLYGISPTDALTFTAVPILLLLIASAACLIPARRAASLDPNRALRCD